MQELIDAFKVGRERECERRQFLRIALLVDLLVVIINVTCCLKTYAQPYSKFDIDSFGTKSEEEWGASTPHPNDRISKYVGDAAKPLDIY